MYRCANCQAPWNGNAMGMEIGREMKPYSQEMTVYQYNLMSHHHPPILTMNHELLQEGVSVVK